MREKMNIALILIDFQNDYFDGGNMTVVNSEMASLNAARILQYFRENKLPIVHIQHISKREGATFFLPNTDGAKIHQNVQPMEKEKIIIKHFPNSFRETELLGYLKEKNISDLVICRMMTHMCVDATTRASKDYGFNCRLIGDACATRNLEFNGEVVKSKDVQNAFLSSLNYYYAQVLTTNKYLEDAHNQ